MSSLSHYEHECANPSDINEHLPVLREYAEKCESVTEFGVRRVCSTWAFLVAKPKRLHSYDIEYHPNIEAAKLAAIQEGVDFKFFRESTLEIEIEPTDFLFIDTLHIYEQLRQELFLHGMKAQKYLGFHDTTTFKDVGELPASTGLWPAIEFFMEDHPEWTIDIKKENCNGLTILKRNA